MPLEARAEVRTEEERPRRVQEARGKVIGEAGTAEPVSIIVTADDALQLDGAPIDHKALEAKLRAHVKRDKSVRVKITIHVELPPSRETELRKLAKRAGVKTIEVSKSLD